MKMGFMLIELLIYTALAVLLTGLVLRFCSMNLASFHAQEKKTAHLVQLHTVQGCLDRLIQEAPCEMSNWLIRSAHLLLWYNTHRKRYESLQFSDHKLAYRYGAYDTYKKKWLKSAKRVLAYGIDSCSWKVAGARIVPQEDVKIESVITQLRLQPALAITTLHSIVGAHVIK